MQETACVKREQYYNEEKTFWECRGCNDVTRIDLSHPSSITSYGRGERNNLESLHRSGGPDIYIHVLPNTKWDSKGYNCSHHRLSLWQRFFFLLLRWRVAGRVIFDTPDSLPKNVRDHIFIFLLDQIDRSFLPFADRKKDCCLHDRENLPNWTL